MKLNLKNPIVFFDLETTGINVSTDRIVELTYLKVEPNGNKTSKTIKINPEMHIPEQSSAIHGIYDQDVADCPTFRQIAANLAKDIEGCDLAGFNSVNFDIPLLVEEFLRVGVDIDLKKRKFVDVMVIFYKKEPRNLAAAYKFYCDKTLENAHSSEADTLATFEILEEQLNKYPIWKIRSTSCRSFRLTTSTPTTQDVSYTTAGSVRYSTSANIKVCLYRTSSDKTRTTTSG